MACACNKNRTQPRGMSAPQGDARPATEAEQARATAAASRPSTPEMQGATQSFALRTSGGTETFGSDLERRAARARRGGDLL